jgi:cyclopropane fatty-acyl-phospholipid synthase-like methyltransferase
MNNFDWIFYTNFYNDIKSAGIDNEEKALDHYKTHGTIENRKISFDVERYLHHNEIYGESLFNINRNNLSLFSIHYDLLTLLIRECNLEKHSKVLEIGCNIACYSLPIIKYLTEGKYYGLESHRDCLGWCRSKILPHCRNTIFRRFIPDKLTIPEGIGINDVDMVYSLSIFITLSPEHIPTYLNAINRILRKGGLLVIALFMWNQTTPTTTRTKSLKTSLVKNNGNSYLTNNYNEHALVHSDSQIYKWLEESRFEVRETIFGSWTTNGQGSLGTPTTSIYQDVIVAIKK